MPSKTFFNLPEQKRNRVIRQGLLEFSAQFYQKASLTLITEKAKIPKGSIYQYFENKKDLYAYLVSYSAQQKLQYLYNIQGKDDFSLHLKELLIEGALYDIQNPAISLILFNSIHETHPDVQEVAENLKDIIFNYYLDIVEKAQKKKQISNKFDKQTVAYYLYALNLQFHELLRQKYGIDIYRETRRRKKLLKITRKDLEKMFEEILRILFAGLEK